MYWTADFSLGFASSTVRQLPWKLMMFSSISSLVSCLGAAIKKFLLTQCNFSQAFLFFEYYASDWSILIEKFYEYNRQICLYLTNSLWYIFFNWCWFYLSWFLLFDWSRDYLFICLLLFCFCCCCWSWCRYCCFRFYYNCCSAIFVSAVGLAVLVAIWAYASVVVEVGLAAVAYTAVAAHGE